MPPEFLQPIQAAGEILVRGMKSLKRLGVLFGVFPFACRNQLFYFRYLLGKLRANTFGVGVKLEVRSKFFAFKDSGFV